MYPFVQSAPSQDAFPETPRRHKQCTQNFSGVVHFQCQEDSSWSWVPCKCFSNVLLNYETSLTGRSSEHAHKSMWLPFPRLPGAQAIQGSATLRWNPVCVEGCDRKPPGTHFPLFTFNYNFPLWLCPPVRAQHPVNGIMGSEWLRARAHRSSASEFHPDN